MNKLEKNIIQESKVSEIEKFNNIIFPKFVKDGLINAFFSDKSKKAFIKAEDINYKVAKWLYDNKVISVIYFYINRKPATYKIHNMPADWIDYEVYKKELDKKISESISNTFKNGIAILK